MRKPVAKAIAQDAARSCRAASPRQCSQIPDGAYPSSPSGQPGDMK